MNRRKFIPLAGLALVASLAAAAPDEDVLGKSQGYPAQSAGPAFSMFKEEFKVGTFSHMDKAFWPRTVKAPPVPSDLPAGDPLPALTYPFEGKNYTVDDFFARQRVTGLLVIKDGKVVLERYQYERRPEMRLASFSMAKTVTGLLAGIALRDGLIASLDDPAEKYASELKGSAWGPVTIRNLLRMSSGVKWSDKVGPGLASDGARLAVESFFRRGRGGASAVSWVKDSDHPQGTRFNYNSAETFALGVVLRAAIKQDLGTYLAEKLWQPMGAEADATWLIDASGLEAGNCCLNARLRDYGRLGMLLANDGMWNGRELVPRDFLLDATDAERQPDYLRPRKASQFFGYGYQTWLYPYKTRTFQARGLFGQELIVQPESKVVIVIASVLKAPDVPPEIFVERNYFTGAILKALGGKTDLYR
ncbi:serine hydrolase [Ramlibacter sp. WS9]|uniref:serine hydrolase domain-containing protein n=1 Tax=Ramlibacter sp. WS9 TaxID=1882741 RepID=UPI001142678B|nr:serine hydrolase [Ramlibacter sp. WS9]ROZ72484.1 class C beta-lactamase-related serine hydrolase [Ramlibacter sp. WS9]